MKKHFFSPRCLSFVVFFCLLMGIVSPVLAAAPPPKNNSAFAKLWINVQKNGLTLSQQLERAEKRSGTVQKMISWAQTLGLETQTLQTALTQFETVLVTLKNAHQQTTQLVAAHVGFDAQGGVINQEQARTTLETVKIALSTERTQLKTARQNFLTVFKTWRTVHPSSDKNPAQID